VLPVVVSEEFLSEIFKCISENPKTELRVDLPAQTITNLSTGKSESFEINPYKKHCLMEGLDDIEYLLSKRSDIENWEENNKR
jgi:3-isopropylmalate/(R)-2-methylmalate dehydratase small subunit